MPVAAKQCVIAPFDFSARSVQGLQAAAEYVDDLAQLHVVHVLPELSVAEPGVIWDTIDDEKRKAHAGGAVHRELEKLGLKGASVHVCIGEAGDEVVELAKKHGADLIVVASHGRTGLKRLLLGSVADRIVRLASCPVLVVKGEN